MTIRYLKQPYEVALGSGNLLNGSVTIQPPAGQFWLPRLIRVGITIGTTLPFPYQVPTTMCTLYHGGTNDLGVDAYIDGTVNGSGDVTGLMNGTIVQPGEFLTLLWQPLDPNGGVSVSNAIGFVEILGLVADTYTELFPYVASSSPGTPFTNPLPSIVHMPPAPENGRLFIFQNPGQNNSVTLIPNPVTNTNGLYIYNVMVLTGTVLANADGYLAPIGGTDRFAYYNPSSTNLNIPVVYEFHGFKMVPGGLRWVQSGSAAVNAITYAINETDRVWPF